MGDTMYRKKEFDKRYLIIIAVIVLAILLVVLSVALKRDRDLSFPEKMIKDSGTFVINVVSTPVNFIKDIIREGREKNDIYEKYKDLKEKEKSINKITAENDNLKKEVDELKKNLELETILSDQFYKHATIVNRNIDYWYDEVTIDKGKKNGIEKDMAVVNSYGLVGKVSSVSNYYSTVKLLSNDNMSDKISVKIKVDDTYVYGLISKYSSKSNTYTVEGISENITIPKGADVVTTGMGGTFPSGLLIGHVTKVTTDNFDLSKVALVKSSVDFDKVDYVTILKRKNK